MDEEVVVTVRAKISAKYFEKMNHFRVKSGRAPITAFDFVDNCVCDALKHSFVIEDVRTERVPVVTVPRLVEPVSQSENA